MKRIYKIFMAVAAVAAVGCTTDATEDLGVNVGGQTTLTLSLDDTRTQLGEKADDTYPLTWAEGDAISVNGYLSNALTEGEANGTTATFTFNNGFGSTPYFVAYPAVEETTNQVVFAAEQTHTSNTTFGNGAAVMYGYATDLSSVKLNHLTGVLKIGVVSGTTTPAFIKEVRISTVDRKPIAGAFNVDAEGKLTPAKGATEVITYKAASDAGLPVGAENPTYIHVAVPAGEYGELYVSLEATNGDVMYKTVPGTGVVNAGAVREYTNNIVFVPTDKTKVFTIASYSDLWEYKEIVKGGSTLDAVLVNDVECPPADGSDVNYPVWESIDAPNYDGTIYGNGYSIKNLNTPLFNQASASFKGLHLDVVVEEKVNPNFGAFARKLIANGKQPKIEHCSVSGTIKINTDVTPAKADVLGDGAVGGFVGYAKYVQFDNCVNNASITLAQYSTTTKMEGVVGGLVGLSDGNISFTNCTNNGALTYSDTSGKTHLYIGGIIAVCIGQAAEILFDNCTNTGNISRTAKSTSRDAHVGGVVGVISGDRDGSTIDTKKEVTFTNSTVNKGAISIVGATTSSYTSAGGIAGRIAYYANVYFNGPVTNYGAISHTGTYNGGYYYFGGIIGYFYSNITAQINNHITNAESATLESSATDQSSGNYIRSLSGIAGCLNENSVVYVNGKTVCNNANLTFTGKCYDACIGGYMGYSNKCFTYLHNKGKVINNGDIEIKNVDASSGLHVAGIVAYQRSSGKVTGENDTDKTGQIANTGAITINGGNANSAHVGGIYGYITVTDMKYTSMINTGDITMGDIELGEVGSYNRIGGIAGRIVNFNTWYNCQSYCTIKATPADAEIGILTGAPGDSSSKARKFTDSKIGGSIQRPGETTIPLTEDNYTTYAISGTFNTFTNCSFLASEKDIDWGDYGKN